MVSMNVAGCRKLVKWSASARTLLFAWGRGQAEPEDPVVEAPTERRQGGSRSSHHRLQFDRRQIEPGEETGAVGVLEEPAAELLIGEELAQDLLDGALAHWTLGYCSAACRGPRVRTHAPEYLAFAGILPPTGANALSHHHPMTLVVPSKSL